MTHSEKIDELKDTISFLYEKEGRGKKYISRLLNVDYRILCQKTNEWKMVKANVSRLTPSNQKFANKNKKNIRQWLDQDKSVSNIAKILNTNKDYLYYIISRVPELNKAFEDKKTRYQNKKQREKQQKKEALQKKYCFKNLPNEHWKKILGYENYEISDKGRVRKCYPKYNGYRLIALVPNVRNGRLYAALNSKNKHANLQVSRLVGFAFVDGYSETKNTINHKDLDISNNCAENLEWISQKENNKHSYKNGRTKAIAFKKHGKFKKLILNNKFEFKTIIACAKFLNISETQMHRYIDGECKNDKIQDIKFVY